jgi:hypothetical protein
LGAWLAWGAGATEKRYRPPAFVLHALSIAMIAGVAAGIEAGQIFLPLKIADPTDFALETIGGLAGYFGLRWLSRAWAPGMGTPGEGQPGAGRDLPRSGAKYPQAGAAAPPPIPPRTD